MKKRAYPQLNETLYMETLDNGLEVFVLPKPGFSKTYATFTAKYGSIDNHFTSLQGEEMVVPDGIAHFLEHKMFESEAGDVFYTFSRQGASANAFTTFNRTAYLFSCTDQVKENLLTLVDFVQDPYFTDENVEKEKGIIGQEIRMYDDDPDWRVYFGLLEAMYQHHPVRIDIAGTIPSISQITKELLYSCYETFYHPSNMLLFVVGAVNPEEVIAWVQENQAQKSFAPPPHIQRYYPEEPKAPRTHEVRQQLAVGLPKLMMGFKEDRLLTGAELLKRELVTELLLESVIGQGSALYQRLYEQDLVDEHFGYECSEEPQYAFSMIGGDTKDPDAVVGQVRESLAALRQEGLDPKVFERVKRKKLGQFMRALNSLEFVANQFTGYRMNGTDFFEILPVMESVTLEEVNQRLLEHLDPQQMVVSIVEPKGDGS